MAIQMKAEPGQWSGAQRWTLTVSCASVSLVIAAMAALYSALPSIALSTGASQTQLTWVVDGYTLALACLVLPAGALGDRYGRRAMQVTGLCVFTFASILPLASTNTGLLIAARTMAGVGAAFVMPSTLSLMTGSFPAQQRVRAIAIWAGVAGVGGVIGILGSGLLLEHWSWQSIFVGLAAAGGLLAVLALTVPPSRQAARPKLDPAGSIWVALTVSLTVYALIEGPERGWRDPVVVASFILSATALLHFLRAELTRAHPLLDVRYFARRAFGSAALSITVQFLVTFGLFLILVQWLQLVLGYSAVLSALALAPLMAPLVILSVLSPWLSERVGQRVMCTTGLIAIGTGLCFFSRLAAGSTYTATVLPMLIISSGLGLCAAPATTAIVTETPAEKHGVAAAVNDASREIGAAIGIAIAGSVLAASYSQHIRPALHYLPAVAREPVAKSLAAALEVAHRAGPRGKPLADFAKIAFLHGIDRAAIVLAVISFLGAVVVGCWTPARAASAAAKRVTPLHPRPHEPALECLTARICHTRKCTARSRHYSFCTCGGRMRWL
jgi:EmrB/QacA subfamily drug resistance transporter